MYNIYVAEKRKKEIDDKEKEASQYLKYRKKFKSKKLVITIISKS